MLIGVGHDLQAVAELADREGLMSPGALFTEDELAYASASRSPLSTLAGMFSAKEAFFKAMPDAAGGFWTDIEIAHDAGRAPRVRLHGGLATAFARRGWCAFLSISHSGAYASAVVVIAPASAAPPPRPDERAGGVEEAT